MTRAAFIGLGVMGYPMAGHLARAGHQVTVFNRTRAKARAWADEYRGAFAETPGDAAKDADIVFACVGRDEDLREVTLGPGGAFAAMKPGAVFINIARGTLVDEDALIRALQTGHLRGAALDVVRQEPLPADSPLWDMPNVILGSHSGSAVLQENGRITELFCDNLRRYMAGEPLRNVLDTTLMY